MWGRSPHIFLSLQVSWNKVHSALQDVVQQELDALGYDLVDLRVGGSRGRPVLDIRIDRLDAQKVQVGDCERASRAIEARLDAMPDLIDGRYVLEVSSPGMERPLRTVAHWRRFVGRRAMVTRAWTAAWRTNGSRSAFASSTANTAGMDSRR